MNAKRMAGDATAAPPVNHDGPLSDNDVLGAFRAEAQHRVKRQLAAGRSVYYSGIGPDADKLYMRMPDGRRFQYRIDADGRREIVCEVTR